MKYKSGQINAVLFSFFIWVLMVEVIHAQDLPTDSSIVNFGYNYSIPEWMVTRSVTTIGTEHLDNSVTTNFGNKLHGQLGGLTVSQTNNEPGIESVNLYSRGVGTFGPGRTMLILVDGFESSYDYLLSEEIESVSLLKDAAAVSMYGMRGANGVLSITTKRGKEGPLKINLLLQTGFESPLRLPNFLGSYDYAQLYNEALNNDGLPKQYSDNDLSAYRSGTDPYFYPDVNWQDQIYRNAAQTSKYNLTFSGGQSNVRYFVMLGYLNRSGILKKTADKTDFSSNSNNAQFNIRGNVDINLSERFSASVNIGYSLSNKSNPANYNAGTIINRISLIPPNAFPVYNPNNSYGGNALYTNPWGDMLETGSFTSNFRIAQTGLKLTYQLDMIAEGLSASVAASFNNRLRSYSSKSRTYDRYSIVKDASGTIEYRQFGEPTSLVASENQFDQWRSTGLQAFLNYKKKQENNLVEAALGYDMNSYTLAGERTDFKHLGVNGRILYAHQMKYIGELSFGYYGSNGFMKGKRFGLFPGVSAGWIVSNEDFLKNNAVVDYLKLKASFGISGNNAVGSQRFLYDQYYIAQGSYIFGSQSIQGYNEATIANPGLTWEKKKEFNFGFDASFINCLKLNFDIFSQNRYDILTLPESLIPGFAGMRTPQLNVGKVDNKGFEALIGYKSKLSGNLNFFADLNIWYAKNKITSIPEARKQDSYQLKEGKMVDQPFLLESLGFFRNVSDVQNSPYQNFALVQEGDIKYKDQNNDGIVDERDFYPTGYTQIPELTIALNAGVQYRNVYLNAFFQSEMNRSVYLSGSDFYAFQNNGKISSIALDRWTSSTYETAKYPRLSSENNLNNYQQSSFWQRDGSFIKLRNIELGYHFSNKVVSKLGIGAATLFISGSNLITWDYVKIADPEILTGYPAMKAYNIGAKIQF